PPPADPADDASGLTTRRSARKGNTGAAEAEAAGRVGQGIAAGAQDEEVAAAPPAPVAPPTAAVVEMAGAEAEPMHEDADAAGDPEGKGARTRGGTTTAAAKSAAGRAKGRYGAGRAGTRRSSTAEEKAKATVEDDAKAEAGAPAEAIAQPTTAPAPPTAAIVAVSERRAEDTVMEDAPGTSAPSPLVGQRQKRQRADTTQPTSATPGGAPGSVTPAQAVTTAATPAATTTITAAANGGGGGEADGEDAPGAAGRARAAKRQTVKPSMAPLVETAGPSAPTTKTSGAGGAAAAPTAAATVAAAASVPGPAAAAGGNTGGGGSSSSSSFEGRLSDRIAAALAKLEQARIQEAEAVSELNNCAQAMYDRPFNFQLYKHSKLAIMVMRASKTAAKAVTGGVLTGEGAGSGAAGGASTATAASGGGVHALAQVAADMKGIVAVIKRLNEAKVPQTQESLREAMHNL
ncbi:hypothetical protein Vretimale_4240, partial [Volvox reticuliferus]